MTGENTDLEFARALVRSGVTGSLATVDRDNGPPHASFVTYALDHSCTPILLLSELALHTRNLLADGKGALLVSAIPPGGVTGGPPGDEPAGDEPAGDDPLASDRVTLRGVLEPTGSEQDRVRFLARHPSARDYADFGDFGFWRLMVQSAHLVGGFGRIHTFDRAAWVPNLGDASDLIAGEADIVAHMNEDHADAIEAYATGLLGKPAGDWIMTGIDPWGADLRLSGRTARLPFDTPVYTPASARAMLVALVKKARA